MTSMSKSAAPHAAEACECAAEADGDPQHCRASQRQSGPTHRFSHFTLRTPSLEAAWREVERCTRGEAIDPPVETEPVARG
jgi:hypothetical protein